MKKLFFLLCCCFVVSYFLFYEDVRSFFRQRHPPQFSIEKLATNISTDFINDVDSSLYSYLKGPFTFLGNGVQSIAFTDSTDTYVLKLFLMRRVHGKKKLPRFQPMRLFDFYRNYKNQKLVEKRLKRLFCGLESYDHVYKHHKEIAALTAVHLNACEGNLPVVELIAENGQSFFVDLNTTLFVFQRKANLVLPFLKSKNSEERRQYLDAMQLFLITVANLGYKDMEKELQMHMNYGFVDGKPVQIDVGALQWVDNCSEQKRLLEEKIRSDFSQWKMDCGIECF